MRFFYPQEGELELLFENVRGAGYKINGNGISRDQERQADSFKSSVIATSPFAKQIILGDILFWSVLDRTRPYDGTGTHPGHKERLENLVRAHPDLAASIGITL